jgi:DNA repair exonuclease SbcCD ATPase subunit
MQPDPLAPQEVKQSESSLVQQAKAPKQNSTSMILVVFLVIMLIAAAGLGFWAYILSSILTTTQQQLTTLQGEHDKLQSDYVKLKSDNEKLTADINQSKADFEKTSGELTAAQADLKKSQEQNKGLQDRIDSASTMAKALYAFSTVKTSADFIAMDALIKATDDKQLLTQWNSFVAVPSTDASVKILLYMISSIQDVLK